MVVLIAYCSDSGSYSSIYYIFGSSLVFDLLGWCLGFLVVVVAIV